MWFTLLDNEFWVMTLRVVIAAVLSGLVGFEREIKNHPAGFRTHLLVGIGSCIMMLLSLYGFEPYINKYENIRFDPARIPSYVISGIGFLGAGTILVKGATIRGLTTAASIWVVAGLGLITGVGMYAPAFFTTIVVLLSLIFLNRFERKFIRSKQTSIEIVIDHEKTCLPKVVKIIEEHKMELQSIRLKEEHDEEKIKKYEIVVQLTGQQKKLDIFDELLEIEGLKEIS